MSETKKRGNPNWVKGGKSPNDKGRPAVVETFRDRARKAVDEHCIEAWVNEVASLSKEWVRCSELLASYGYGKPSQTVNLGSDGAAPVEFSVRLIRPNGDSGSK